MAISRTHYIENNSYIQKEEAELIDFCEGWLANKRKNEWFDKESIKKLDMLSRRVLALYTLRGVKC